jgi:VRR-NUC domain
MSEHNTQAAFFNWLALSKIDGVELAYAVPNGGARHPAVAAKLKKEGVKAGIPDVVLPVARGGFIGLSIEFKHGDGSPSKEQRERINAWQKEGWCVTLCWDWQAATRFVIGYLGCTTVKIQE